MPDRSGFLTFISIWYGLGVASQLSNVLPLFFYTLILLIANPLLGIALLAFDVLMGTVIVLSILFITKAWVVDHALKRWTDIVHMLGVFIQLLLLIMWSVTVPLVPGLEIDQTGYVIVLVWFAFAVLLEAAFWLGIRTHLARLEREGRASFDPGLFNRHA